MGISTESIPNELPRIARKTKQDQITKLISVSYTENNKIHKKILTKTQTSEITLIFHQKLHCRCTHIDRNDQFKKVTIQCLFKQEYR